MYISVFNLASFNIELFLFNVILFGFGFGFALWLFYYIIKS